MQPTSLPSLTKYIRTVTTNQLSSHSQHFTHFQAESWPFAGHSGHPIAFIPQRGELSKDCGARSQGQRRSQSISPDIRPQVRFDIWQRLLTNNKLQLPYYQKPIKIPRCPRSLPVQSIHDLAAIFLKGKLCLIMIFIADHSLL